MTSCSISVHVPFSLAGFGWIRMGSRSSVGQSPFTCKKQKPSWNWLERKEDFIGKTLGKLTDLRVILRSQDTSRNLKGRLEAGASCCGIILITPGSYSFSSVTQEAMEFLSLASGKYFRKKLIGLVRVSFPDLCPLNEANYQKRWGRNAKQIKQ